MVCDHGIEIDVNNVARNDRRAIGIALGRLMDRLQPEPGPEGSRAISFTVPSASLERSFYAVM